MLLSEYLGKDIDFKSHGVFEPVIDRDSKFFINLQRLRKTEIPEFKDSITKINNHFGKIIKLLLRAQKKDVKFDQFYKTALGLFNFHEVNGICLGYSESHSGAGFGDILTKEVLSTAYDIVKAGIDDPEFFQLMSLFQENVGADRLSDMMATILLENIKAYTLRINRELRILDSNYPNHTFTNGLLYNEKKRCEILLLPLDILHKLPIAESWEDIDNVIEKNIAIREELNREILDGWAKYKAWQKKAYILNEIFKKKERFHRVIKAYKEESLDLVDISYDSDYYLDLVTKDFSKENISWSSFIKSEIDTYSASLEILNIFGHWVEYNKGWELIQEINSNKREKAVQRLLHLGCKNYIEVNNLDSNFETDMGRGPEDLKISRGGDKTVIEIKLSSNNQYMHGYETQIEEYANAEKTKNRIYVLIDVGNPGRVKKLLAKHEKDIIEGRDVAKVIIIDATPKDSASIYLSK